MPVLDKEGSIQLVLNPSETSLFGPGVFKQTG